MLDFLRQSKRRATIFELSALPWRTRHSDKHSTWPDSSCRCNLPDNKLYRKSHSKCTQFSAVSSCTSFFFFWS